MKPVTLFLWFRRIAIAEGISFIILLFAAMPLKYFAGIPLAVTIVGAIHGVLFIAFIILAREVKVDFKKDLRWFIRAFIASLLPFGTLIMDKEWKKEVIPARCN